MAEDYYKTLGVNRDASQADIQKAYRNLARKYHPDLNPDDKTAKEKFQKVQAAFDVLNDQSKRELYDRYGSSFESMQGSAGPGGGRAYGGGAGPAGFEEFDFSQLFGGGRATAGDPLGGFGDIFGQFRRGGGKRARPTRADVSGGEDVRSEIEVPFQTAVTGGQAQLSVERASGKVDTITVKIPPGIPDGGKIRLRGQGEAAPDGGPPGDIVLTVRIAPHPHFQRRGNHLDVKVPVTLHEAVFGGKVDIPTPTGTISLRIPPRTSSGKKLRVRGHGVKPKNGEAGDLYAEVQIVLPDRIDEQTLESLSRMEGSPPNPRADLRW